MWESICLTLMATAGNNIGKVLQKKGTVVLPPLSLKPKVLKAYLFNTSWIIGFVMDMVGAAFMLKALSLAPVSIIQPVSGCGLAILAIFSYFYLKEVMNALDWIGIVLAGIGTIGVGIGGEEQRLSTVSLLRLPWLVFSITILFVLLNAWLHIYKSKRRDQELLNYEVVEEIISGLESGILFGLASVISKLGFIFFEQGFSKILIPICISISICCSAFGFFCQDLMDLPAFLQHRIILRRIVFCFCHSSKDSRTETWKSYSGFHMHCSCLDCNWCVCWYVCPR